MKVIWSPRAVARAAEIATYIAADRPDAAAEWVDALFAAVAGLPPITPPTLERQLTTRAERFGVPC